MEERETFEKMMRENGPRIYTLSIRLCGNETAGADLAQDTFVKAWEAWSTFRGEADAGTWLYRICVNTWKNRVRSEKRRFFWKHFSIGSRGPDDDGPEFDIADNQPAVADELARQDDQMVLKAALAALSEEERGIVIMADVDEKPYDIMAALLDIPVGTVRSRLSRARAKLVKEFEKRQP